MFKLPHFGDHTNFLKKSKRNIKQNSTYLFMKDNNLNESFLVPNNYILIINISCYHSTNNIKINCTCQKHNYKFTLSKF